MRDVEPLGQGPQPPRPPRITEAGGPGQQVRLHAQGVELGHQVLLPVEEVGHLVVDGLGVGHRRHRHEQPLGPAGPQPLDHVQHPHRLGHRAPDGSGPA